MYNDPKDQELATCYQCKEDKCEGNNRICKVCWSSYCAVCNQWHDSLRRVRSYTRQWQGPYSTDTYLCKYCRQTTTVEEAQALLMTGSFHLWKHFRREDSIGDKQNACSLAQPAPILSWLFLGDYCDASNFMLLKSLSITAVLSCCPEQHSEDFVKTLLAKGIELSSLRAEDDMSGDYNIISEIWPTARKTIASWKDKKKNILVNCWGGINRSSAIVIAWLLMEENYTFYQAMYRITELRGTVLTNQMFRLQLLKLSREVPSS